MSESTLRVKPEERVIFHNILDTCIEKLESPKNRDKVHWETLPDDILFLMLETEIKELALAIKQNKREDKLSEIKDIVNLSMFLAMNIWGRE